VRITVAPSKKDTSDGGDADQIRRIDMTSQAVFHEFRDASHQHTQPELSDRRARRDFLSVVGLFSLNVSNIVYFIIFSWT
jgi:hypothetical protein